MKIRSCYVADYHNRLHVFQINGSTTFSSLALMTFSVKLSK